MIWREWLAIHLVSQHNTLIPVHGPVQFNRSPVESVWLYIGLVLLAFILLYVAMAFVFLTNLSAPSMHTYLARRRGFALRRISAIIGPVNRAVDKPAGPHENPFDFRTVFCSFRLLPAQTSVIGAVI